MSKLSGGQIVTVPALSGGGKTTATFVRYERKVVNRRMRTVAVVRYRRGGAEFRYDPSQVTR